MTIIILLALSFGSPDMSFPWWVWLLSTLHTLFSGYKGYLSVIGLLKST